MPRLQPPAANASPPPPRRSSQCLLLAGPAGMSTREIKAKIVELGLNTDYDLSSQHAAKCAREGRNAG